MQMNPFSIPCALGLILIVYNHIIYLYLHTIFGKNSFYCQNATEASYTHQIWCRGSLLILELISIVFVAAAAAAAASLQHCSKYENMKTTNIAFFQ